MTTAAEIITEGLRLFGIIDQTEDAQPADIANGVKTLTNILCNENADGACQYLIKRVNVTLPAGVSMQVYSFRIGTQQAAYEVQYDAVAVRDLWMNDQSPSVNRTTRIAPISDVVRTTQLGIITKWHQERQSDGSILVTAWQPPRTAPPCLIEYGARLPAFTKTDGSDVVGLPPEGVQDAALLFGRRVYKSYGVVMQPTDIILQDAERVNTNWRNWARGQQWLQFRRA